VRGLPRDDSFLRAFDQIPGFDLKGIKLGNGVVGKTTNAIMALLAFLSVVAFRISQDMLLYIGAAGALIFLIYFAVVIVFAKKYPNIAALEGAELIAWRQMDMAASDPKIIEGAPNTAPPPQIRGE
jgi:hypothetical protein